MITNNINDNEPSLFQRLLGRKSDGRESLAGQEQIEKAEHMVASLMSAIGKAQ
ncbi:MAG: hypothetical protein ACI9JR_003091, partial [Gammaproteobacteria bacterium]